MCMNFGELIQQLRSARQLTLRRCSADLGVDPSNWSKMERGVTPPPKQAGILECWANFFQLAGDEKQEFFDLAALARGELPADVASDQRVLNALPGLFRALRGFKPEGATLSELVEDIPMPDGLHPEAARRKSHGNRLRSQALRRAAPEPTPHLP